MSADLDEAIAYALQEIQSHPVSLPAPPAAASHAASHPAAEMPITEICVTAGGYTVRVGTPEALARLHALDPAGAVPRPPGYGGGYGHRGGGSSTIALPFPGAVLAGAPPQAGPITPWPAGAQYASFPHH